mmetsp:Transcript_7994/g.14503  ORF Transcript_7994/g.14503 Transcript_7994/m.14503 type:complete len:164 (+) Transcript_7994:214-705(+)
MDPAPADADGRCSNAFVRGTTTETAYEKSLDQCKADILELEWISATFGEDSDAVTESGQKRQNEANGNGSQNDKVERSYGVVNADVGTTYSFVLRLQNMFFSLIRIDWFISRFMTECSLSLNPVVLYEQLRMYHTMHSSLQSIFPFLPSKAYGNSILCVIIRR